MILPGEKFSCIALRPWRHVDDAEVQTLELGADQYAMPGLPFEIPSHAKERLGGDGLRDLERSTVVLLVKRNAKEPEVEDIERLALSRRVMRLYIALLFVTPGIGLRSVRQLNGVGRGDGSVFLFGSDTQPPVYRVTGTPEHWEIRPPHLRHAVKVARGLLATHSTGDFHRMSRVSASIREALTARTLTTRVQQSVRALEGLVLPPNAGNTAPVFSDRVKFFLGSGEHVTLLRDLYRVRGKLEHLHGPTVAIQEVRPDIGDDDALTYLAFAAFVAENLAKACVVRVYERPKLWHYFSTDEGLEQFWKAPKKANAWGEPIDLPRILRAFEKGGAQRDLVSDEARRAVDDEADTLDKAWG